MKCVLIVRSGDERIQRSCELPDGVSTREQLQAFVKSQDLRLHSVDFTFAVSLVERAAGATEGKGEKALLRGDADVRNLLQTAERRRATHVLTVEATITGSAASPRNLGSFLSAEYAVDNELVTLHIFAPPKSPAHRNSASCQEKTFVIPKRFVLESLTRAVEDTLSISPTKSGMRLTLYTTPQQPNDDRVEITDDAVALRLLRQHASQRAPVRLTYVICSRTPAASPHEASRRASQQLFTAPLAPSSPPAPAPAPSESAAGPRNPKPHPPPLSNVASQPLSPSSSKPSQAPPGRKDATSSPRLYRAAATPPSPVTPPSSPPAAAAAPSPDVPLGTPRRALLRESTTSVAKYEARVQVRPAASEGATTAAVTAPLHELCFVYTKEELHLWRRFAAECEAAIGAEATPHVPVLSSDASVLLDSDSMLREWLALSRESKQPLRVRLLLRHPSTPPPAETEVPMASVPKSLVRERGAAGAVSDVTSAIATVPGALPVSRKQSGPTVAPLDVCCSENSSPSVASLCASLPRPSHNGGGADGVGATPRPLSLSQQHSPTSLQDASASPVPTSRSKVGSSPLSTQHTSRTSKASFSSADTEDANDAKVKACEESSAEAGAPPLVMCTSVGPSDAAATAARSLCFSEDDDGKRNSVRFQIPVCWGSDQHMVLCRLRDGTALDDLRRAALEAFCNGAAGIDDASPLALEVRYVAEGHIFCVRLDADERLLGLRGELLVDSAEILVTAPSTPPCLPRTQEASRSTGAAQISDAVGQLIADAVLQDLGARPPATSTEIRDILCAKLGEQAATQPIRGFLDAAVSTPFDASTPEREGDASFGARLVLWLSSVLARVQEPRTSSTGVAVEVASSLLCSRLCDVNFLLDQLAASVCVVGRDGEDGDDETRSIAMRLSLASLWTEAGLIPPENSSAAAWNPFLAAHVGGPSGWKAAYAAAPAAVLDLISAGRMDGVWAFPYLRDAQTDAVWRRGLAKAHRDCCKSINAADLERFFKSEDFTKAAGALDHRRVILSCVGALLAPPSAAVIDYAEWLAHRFRGKVATVLYTNMIDYDGSASLSAFTVTQLSWTLLHPQLRCAGEAASLPTTLDRLHTWALLATQRVCQQHRMSFPPCPLFRLHTASPVPFIGPSLPATAAADSAVADSQGGTRVSAAPLPPPCDVAAADSAAAPLSPSPPPAGAPHVLARVPAPRKLQYDYKYNFNAFRRPRSSKG
ncbi:hypothetical protein LSCM1_06356 [Leishmania martiniquensis]|uniref:Uncharacterized protein n=1 Tax=Leishmania martiniquensis TaxID=1580590 RepID=A0A836HNP7_9TRYP|nr:hypothetical protein LSCM1_06356 [Leishmania martiniquensis]